MSTISFEVYDFVVFCSTILISLSIGIFYALRGQRQRTTTEFLMADRQMGYAPVSMSLIVTIMSAITVLGVPSTIYLHGTSYWGFSLSYFIFIPLLAHFVMPVLYDLRLTSAYEYLELRFSPRIKLCGTISYVLMMTVYMSVVLYAPALALNAVSGLNVWISVVSLCVVCAIYTTIGGMKAVIWTDVFQACVMFLAQILVLALGVHNLGGFGKVFEIAMENNKIAPIDFNPSPFVTHTFWSLSIGGTFLCLNIFGTNQSAVQRFLCCKTKKDARIMLYLNLPLLHFVMVLGCVIGLIMFAEFRCDNPLAKGAKPDQLLIYYVMHVLKGYTGFAGLFTGCLFAASLSTISSCFNSLATVTLHDLIRPVYNMSDLRATVIAKILVCFYAAVCLCTTLIASQVDSLLNAALSILGVMGGPLLSMFLIGMCCRYVNSSGMFAGFLTSMTCVFLIGYGSLVYRMTHATVPNYPVQIGTDCPADENVSTNATTMASTTVASIAIASTTMASTTVVTNATTIGGSELYSGVYFIFKLSYMWYSGLSVLISFLVSVAVSCCTEKEHVDETTLIPFFRKRSCGRSRKHDNEMTFYTIDTEPNKENLINVKTIGEHDGL